MNETIWVARTEVVIPPKDIGRFWLDVTKGDPDDCWTWNRYRDKNGYGHLKVSGKMVLAHRFSFRVTHGYLDPKQQVDHKCHNPPCVNPKHLQATTNQKNSENRRGAHVGSKSGIRGVHWHKANQKWLVKICLLGKEHYLGSFSDLHLAEATAVAGRLRLMTNNLTDYDEWKKVV